MRSSLENETRRGNGSDKKAWNMPTLRRLPIAATAAGGKVITSGNDGTGGGKGDTSSLMS
jgi:hypothetical protein